MNSKQLVVLVATVLLSGCAQQEAVVDSNVVIRHPTPTTYFVTYDGVVGSIPAGEFVSSTGACTVTLTMDRHSAKMECGDLSFEGNVTGMYRCINTPVMINWVDLENSAKLSELSCNN